jgi:23S rRNA (adenine2503-C2)-methyltransferase
MSTLSAGAYRARQVYRWLHVRNTLDPRRMTDLPAALRAKLAERFPARPLRLDGKQASRDGSLKYVWLTARGDPVEAVLMPGFEYGVTACLSTQSGCALGCRFCKTGELGLRANLSAGGILQQLYESELDSGLAVDRAVLMGMGEPLLNLATVRQAVQVLTGSAGRKWSPRRITLSTVGLTQPLLDMARSFPRVNLALSLHFTTNAARRQHMPKAEAELPRLAEALYYYWRVNGGKVTIEYMLLGGLNDSDGDAGRLAQFARLSSVKPAAPLVEEAESRPRPARLQPLPLHVNLLEYNPTGAPGYMPASEARLNHFAGLLRDAGVPVTVRHSRGRDIAAACGMLGAAYAAH